MFLIIDAVLALIFIVAVYISYKKGFVGSLVSILSYFVAFIIAFSSSTYFAHIAYNNYVREKIVNSVSEKIENAVNYEDVLELLPGYISKAVESYNANSPEVVSQVNTSLDSSVGKASEATAQKIVDLIAAPLVIGALRAILFFALFIISMFILRFIGKKLNYIVSKIPLLGKANALLGAAIGLIKGILLVMIACALMGTILPYFGDSIPLFSRDVLDKSVIFGFANEYNPIRLFFS